MEKQPGAELKGRTLKVQDLFLLRGGALTLIKRLPFMKGKGKNKSLNNQPIGVNVKLLNSLKKDTIVDIKSLIENKIVNSDVRRYGVKILGNGKLTVSLIVKLPASKGALKKIREAGGKIEI